MSKALEKNKFFWNFYWKCVELVNNFRKIKIKLQYLSVNLFWTIFAMFISMFNEFSKRLVHFLCFFFVCLLITEKCIGFCQILIIINTDQSLNNFSSYSLISFRIFTYLSILTKNSVKQCGLEEDLWVRLPGFELCYSVHLLTCDFELIFISFPCFTIFSPDSNNINNLKESSEYCIN